MKKTIDEQPIIHSRTYISGLIHIVCTAVAPPSKHQQSRGSNSNGSNLIKVTEPKILGLSAGAERGDDDDEVAVNV